jgi:hypothetical protein
MLRDKSNLLGLKGFHNLAASLDISDLYLGDTGNRCMRVDTCSHTYIRT